jgi:hypothetical protein
LYLIDNLKALSEGVYLGKRALLGILGGLIILVVTLSIILYSDSDFDAQLIDQVDKGVPAEELIVQIDEETLIMQRNAKKRLESVVMDKKYWGNGDLASPTDYQYFTTFYITEMNVISNYDGVRKKFARREITKEQFLQEIKVFKEFFNIY